MVLSFGLAHLPLINAAHLFDLLTNDDAIVKEHNVDLFILPVRHFEHHSVLIADLTHVTTEAALFGKDEPFQCQVID